MANRPKDLLAKAGNVVHQAIVRATGGRVLGKTLGMPALILETTGRKSGKARSVMLTAPVHDGDTYVLVASYGGDANHPAWFLNLRDDPNVTITVDGQVKPMLARIVPPEEKAELWPRVVAAYRGYGQYQQRTARDIPLVVLEPR